MSTQPPVLTIDGPGGSGKGEVSRRVAHTLGWHLLDSGALYRVLALIAQQAGISVAETERLGALARLLRVEFSQTTDGGECIRVDGRDITQSVRSEDCGARASEIAAIPAVRVGLKALQHGFHRPPGLVADGRDMGTAIFPEAGLKIFLTASIAERAKRRYNQLKQKGLDANLPALFRDITARDERDQNRPVSPLKPALEAVVMDTTGMAVEEVVSRVLKLARQRFGKAGG
ncbi:MAG: (d)CMP kinase [Gammaproteobacteria bacterium]|nr:(d)CMP kinase [Gammaproteobacteria bacterium]